VTCINGRIQPSNTTKLRLFADSGGYCSNPSCLAELFVDTDDEVIHVGEIAHVISAGDSGPRADTRTTAEDRSQYDNLILLCPTCHTIVDKAESSYPVDLLLTWKRNHKQVKDEAFGSRMYESRQEARKALDPMLRENQFIFSTYGPMTDERFNPESTLPRLWRRKIRTKIIPNNRKILSLCDANRSHLLPEEEMLLEAFRQHVDDFEAKHLLGVEEHGSRFPEGFDAILA